MVVFNGRFSPATEAGKTSTLSQTRASAPAFADYIGILAEGMADKKKTLAKWADSLPFYTIVKDKITCPASAVPTACEALRKAFPDAEARDGDGINAPDAPPTDTPTDAMLTEAADLVRMYDTELQGIAPDRHVTSVLRRLGLPDDALGTVKTLARGDAAPCKLLASPFGFLVMRFINIVVFYLMSFDQPCRQYETRASLHPMSLDLFLQGFDFRFQIIKLTLVIVEVTLELVQ